jgi:hypothetical protein
MHRHWTILPFWPPFEEKDFMPKHFRLTGALTLCGAMVLTGCTEAMMAGGTSKDSETVTALRAKGFKPVARDTEGLVIAMSYTGPVTDAVVCGKRRGPKEPLTPRMTDLDSVEKRATLDAYLILREGEVVQGIYAIVLRTPGAALEGIDFGPGQSRSFASGLTCTSA